MLLNLSLPVEVLLAFPLFSPLCRNVLFALQASCCSIESRPDWSQRMNMCASKKLNFSSMSTFDLGIEICALNVREVSFPV